MNHNALSLLASIYKTTNKGAYQKDLRLVKLSTDFIDYHGKGGLLRCSDDYLAVCNVIGL